MAGHVTREAQQKSFDRLVDVVFETSPVAGRHIALEVIAELLDAGDVTDADLGAALDRLELV